MKCLNWKVIAALVAAGVGLHALVSGLAAAAVPLLAMLACPLSMVLMMRAMGPKGGREGHDDASATHSDEVTKLRAERQTRSEAS